MSQVLVTGGSGFISGHIIIRLLEDGHRVRTTLRSLGKEESVRGILRAHGVTDGQNERLSFVAADLTNDAGWAEAISGVDYVLHVASPVHIGKVADEADVIGPARAGTLRVLRAAVDASVKRVVLTSAFHAVGFGHRPHREFTEADWSPVLGPGMDAYGRSKVMAEKAAWDFMKAHGGATELTTMLPVAVMGPMMGPDISGSNHLIQQMLTGKMPVLANIYLPIVDVRDVATAHVAAMTAESAAGERILVATGEPAVALKDVSGILREELGEVARKVPTRKLPDAVVKAVGLVSKDFRTATADLGYQKRVSVKKLNEVLGVYPRSEREAIVAAGRSMVENGAA